MFFDEVRFFIVLKYDLLDTYFINCITILHIVSYEPFTIFKFSIIKKDESE